MRTSERKRTHLGYSELLGAIRELAQEHGRLAEAFNVLAEARNADVGRINLLLTEAQIQKQIILDTAHHHSVLMNRTVPFTEEDWLKAIDKRLAELRAEQDAAAAAKAEADMQPVPVAEEERCLSE